MKKILSVVLSIILIMQYTVVSFAYSDQVDMEKKFTYQDSQERQLIYTSIYEGAFVNLGDFSTEEQSIIYTTYNNPQKYIVSSGVYGGQVLTCYNTDNEKSFICITNGIVEIVEFIDSNSIRVNGELIHYEFYSNMSNQNILYSANSAKMASDWIETSYLDKSWIYQGHNWIDVHFENKISNLTLTVIAAVLSAAAGLPFGTSLLFSLATYLAGSPYTNTSVAAMDIYTFLDTTSSAPLLWYRKDSCYGYAYNPYNGQYVYLGQEYKYFFLNLV